MSRTCRLGDCAAAGKCGGASGTSSRILPAVFRSVHREASLSWMTQKELCCYLRNFLAQFVPGCTASDWTELEDTFTCVGSPWDGTGPISVDMLKQFLMHEIMEAICFGLGNFHQSWRTASGDFQIQPEQRSELFCGHP